MKNTLLTAVFCLIFFISADMFIKTDEINAEDLSGSGQTVEENKSADINENVTNQNTEKNVIDRNNSENSANDSNKIEKTQQTEDNQSTKIEKTDNNKNTEQKQTSNIRNIPDKRSWNTSELLEINDGDFKYKRIPGISLNNEKPINENTAELNIISDIKEPPDNADDKGLFGLKKKTSDILIKILLFCLIAVIFILFKFRSKSRGDGNVLRRFPGA